MDSAVIEDLRNSGLEAGDLKARDAGPPEFAATKSPGGAKGYVIPYFDIHGKLSRHYRIKLFDSDVKYRQPANTGNHIYYPPGFAKNLRTAEYVLLTEGEKKAAAACKRGFAACALGGVDSWKNRTIILPMDSEIEPSANKKTGVRVRLPAKNASEGVQEDLQLAVGLKDLIDMAVSKQLTIILCFDTEADTQTKFEVQRAASTLAHEMHFHGLSSMKIKQLILPAIIKDGKTGLDDYLLKTPVDKFNKMCLELKNSTKGFPRHPNAKDYINRRLNSGRLSRQDSQEVAMTMIAELDASGARLISNTDHAPYYFDEQSHALMPTNLQKVHDGPLHESKFGAFLYRRFGVGAGDTRTMGWLATLFTGEDPVGNVTPRRIIAQPTDNPDCIAIQISNANYVVISGDKDKPITLHTNGDRGLLFEQDHVTDIESDELLKAFTLQMSKPIKPWWYEVFKNNVKLSGSEETVEQAAWLGALLYYISPFLFRWRGTQLPIELIIGEAGSGKSSLYELRQTILTGISYLRNIPEGVKDWYSSIANAGGLHVIDNVQLSNKDLRQRLSDEMCRIVTESKPHIEMRTLYTTTGQTQVPVNVVFAMTAIQMPFYNADLIQRSSITELASVGSKHDGNWVQHRIKERGGRAQWLAHQMVVLHKFLALAKSDSWDRDYRASHRLVNYEQALVTMAEVFGQDGSWIPEAIVAKTIKATTEADWTLEGLKDFAQYHIKRSKDPKAAFSAQTIAEWAEISEEYKTNAQLSNSRSIGRYLQTHKMVIEKACGITENGTRANKKIYLVDHKIYA